MENLIEVTNLNKRYGHKVILQDIDLTISKGQSIALIGHNGCGKSTLLKILCGLTTYQNGELVYLKKLKFNYVPEHFPKLPITAREYMNHIGLIEGLSKEYVEKRCNELFCAFFMEDMVDNPIKNLSKGTMQKVSVIQAILTKPDILLLDEPLSGQDVESQKVFINIIKKMNEEGVTIVMSCHEELLINAVSKTVYEIKNKNLHLSQKFINLGLKESLYDVMVFLSKNQSDKDTVSKIKVDNAKTDDIETDNVEIDNAETVKDQLSEFVSKIEKNGDETKLFVNKEKSNFVLREMLNHGYELRRMYDENI